MELYGNILTIYNSTDTQIKNVKKMINDLGFPFELLENTFFFGTTSIKKSKDFQKDLAQTNIEYTFFFLSNPDGSTIKANMVDQNVVDKIDGIFFGDI